MAFDQTSLPAEPERDVDAGSGAFWRELKAEVAAHFASSGASPYASGPMVLKSVTMVSAYFGSYALILICNPPLWAALPLCAAMGAAMAGIGFAVAHDALHGAFSPDPGVNRAVALLFEAIGANGYAWRLSHNGAHHSDPNVFGMDEDVEVTPLLRLSPHARRRAVHRFQHWFAFPLYALTTLNWILVKDFAYFGRSLLVRGARPIPASAWAGLLIGKLLFCAAMVAPFFLLQRNLSATAAELLTVHIVAGTIIGGVFQLAHVVEATEHLDGPQTARAYGGRVARQLQTTSNFAPNNRILSWFVGGLNFQVEHHLFPRVCHTHYAGISPIVRRLAERHGLAYHSIPTLSGAVASHLRTLKLLGAPTRVQTALAA